MMIKSNSSVSFLRCLIVAACALACVASAHASGIDISKEGKSAYVIVIADNAIPAEQSAADELQDYLTQITGARLPIQRESDVAIGDAPLVLVGQTNLTRRMLSSENWESLGQDGIIIKTSGDRLILAGGRPRGALYAVDSFLENTCGVRWWTSTESTIPHKPSLHIENLDTTYVPKLKYRESYNYDAIGDHARFATRLKLNGHMTRIPDSLGGHYTLIGWCHTSFQLIPPSKYFAKHPEWFARLNGHRQAGTQLCLSNPELRKELIKNALALVRKNPQAGIISISQNDCIGPCQCDQCQKIVKEEGSQSGPWIRLCNEAAAAINKEYPNFLVETLAYQYTRHPPKLIKPSDHVLVRLCSIECDFAHPLESKSNQAFADDLRGWAKISPNLFIWNYVTDFTNYLIPHPNLAPLGADLRFFVDHHVVGVFEQGDAQNHLAGDMLPLRLWLLGHLMWDPSQDQSKLTKEFLDGYYGPGGAYIQRYLDLINAPAKSDAFHVGCFSGDARYISDDMLAKATALFDQAAEAVADEKDYSRRVTRARLVVDHLNLLRYDMTHIASAPDPHAEQEKYRAKITDWANRCREMGVRHISEAQNFKSYWPTLLARADQAIPVKLPAPGAPLKPRQFDIQEDRFTLYEPPTLSELVDDPKASNHRAARMPGGRTDWAVQFHIPKDAPFAGKGPWRCYVVVRVQNKGSTGGAFQMGLFNTANHTHVFLDRPGMSIAGDGEYHTYSIPVRSLEPTMYFWVAPAGNGAVGNVYVDRIFIEKTGG
jgi:hypothetical protein